MSEQSDRQVLRGTMITVGKGIGTLLPLLVTVYVVYLLGAVLEDYFGGLLRSVMPDVWYFPGLGFLVGLVVLVLMGLLVQMALMQSVLHLFEGAINRVPLLKSVYGSIRDFTEYFQSRSKSEMSSVVLYQPIESEPARLVGFRMSEKVDPHIHSEEEGGWCSIYLPMSYQVGGFTLIVPTSRIVELDWSFEEAMRYVLTAGVKSPQRGESSSAVEASSS